MDLAIANQDAVLLKLLRNAAGHAMSSQSSNPVVMEKLVDAILKSSGDYFNVRRRDPHLDYLSNYNTNIWPITGRSFRITGQPWGILPVYWMGNDYQQ